MHRTSSQTSRHIDYVAGTFVDFHSPAQVFAALPSLSALFRGAREGVGRHGYRSGLMGAGAQIWFDGLQGMGVHIEVTGNGCGLLFDGRHEVADAAVEDAGDGGPCVDATYAAWFAGAIAAGMKFSRIDLACDTQEVTYDRVIEHLEARAFSSHFQKWEERRSGSNLQEFGNSDRGRTVYLGSRKSDSFLRIYEASCVHAELLGDVLRFELELKGKRAVAAAAMLARGEVSELFGCIRSAIEFRDLRSENKRRRVKEVAEWWTAVIGVAKSMLPVVRDRVEVTMERIRDWHIRQVVPSMFALRRLLGSEVFQAFIDAGEYRAKRRYGDLLPAGSS